MYISIMFVPWVISDVVTGATWRWLLNPDFGLADYILSPLGVKASDLLSKPAFALVGIVIVTIWKSLAYSTLLLLAGLQSISKDYIEASKLDGCSSFATFWYVTMPLMKSTLFVVGLLSVINCMNQSGFILVLTRGGPLRSTETLALYLYKEAFLNYHLTNAASLSIIMAGFNIIIVLLYFFVSKANRLGGDLE